MYHAVMIEWDGDKPPTTFYNRMKSLGLRVGRTKDKSDSPLSRRAKLAENNTRGNKKNNNIGSDFQSVIAQEGFFLTVSEQLATAIANYATESGAKTVMVFNATESRRSVSTQDAEVLQRLEGKLGKRGRPTKIESVIEWTVTCREEGKSFIVNHEKVVNCPHCGSPRIGMIAGGMDPVKVSPGLSIFETWRRARFTRGEFVATPVDDNATVEATEQPVEPQNESITVRLISASAPLLKDVEAIAAKLGRDIALRCLDLVFLARTYTSTETRRLGRVAAVTELLQRGVGPQSVSIIESAANLDLLDGAYADPMQTASLWSIAHKTE